MSKLLVKFADNWADEMDIEGFFVTTKEDWECYKKSVRRFFEENDCETYCVGSNEDIEYRSYQDVMSAYSTREISDKEAEVLSRLGLSSFGFQGPDFDEYDFDDEDIDESDETPQMPRLKNVGKDMYGQEKVNAIKEVLIKTLNKYGVQEENLQSLSNTELRLKLEVLVQGN